MEKLIAFAMAEVDPNPKNLIWKHAYSEYHHDNSKHFCQANVLFFSLIFHAVPY